MKTRTGFVSNSSSSSFVVLLPVGFKFEDLDVSDKKLDEIFAYFDTGIDPDGNKIDGNNFGKAEKIEFLKKLIKRFMKNEWFSSYDDGDMVGMVGELLEDYVVATFNTGPDEGGVVLADPKKVKKILKA